MKRIAFLPALAVALVALAGVMALSILLGSSDMPVGVALRALIGRGDARDVAIVQDLRFARALLAALCGGALAAAGTVFQGVFRNPLADPFVMGVSGGAALGAVLALVAGMGTPVATTAAAFVGGLAAAGLAWRLGRVHGRTPVATLLLAGFAVGSFCSALLAILLLVKAQSWQEVLAWLFGSCDRPDAWRRVALVAPVMAVGLVPVLLRLRELNVLLAGEEPAQYLGVDVERSKAWLTAAGAVLTATAVSAVGIVGFVGLVVPHAARALVGPDHRRLLPVSVAAGAAVLAGADLVARGVMPSHELPVGAITAILGAPFFLVLLRRKAA